MITILIPTYNSEEYLKRALGSILGNGLKEFEIRIVDNLSTDKTAEIVKGFKDKRIHFISQKDNGLYQALNRGIKRAKGGIIGWIGADDFYEPKALEKIASTFNKNKDINWVVGEGYFVFEGNEKRFRRHHRLPKNIGLKDLVKVNPLMSPSVFFRKSFFEEVNGFDENYQLAADYDLWLKFALKEKPFILKRPLSNFSYNQTNLSCRKKAQMYQETIKILNTLKDPKIFPQKAVNILRLYLYIFANKLRIKND